MSLSTLHTDVGSKYAKKAVKFSPLAEVGFYKSLDEPDVQEHYFSREDYKAFRKANVKTVKQLHKIYLLHLPKGPSSKKKKKKILPV